MEGQLELLRRTHEEIERVEDAAVAELMLKPKAHREKLAVEHKVAKFLERIHSRSRFLLDLYKDEDGSRKTEIAAMSTPNEFTEFYNRLKSIKDIHRRNPNEIVEPMELEFVRHNVQEHEHELEGMFTAEEGLGRFLDLHALHDQYMNLQGIERVSYVHFLDSFDRFEEIPLQVKRGQPYKSYLENLRSYLEHWISRSLPLTNIAEVTKAALDRFQTDWESESVSGWEPREHVSKGDGEDDPADLFCAACEKRFAKRTVYDAHLSGKKHLKASETLLKNGVSAVTPKLLLEKRMAIERRDRENDKPIAAMEAQARALGQFLNTQRDDTKANVERKQTITDAEREDEGEEVEIPAVEGEEEEKIYNPLKLPLGWDGKPIPYWLYKLHGLSVEYPCEICGNFVYMGRKAFDRHFQEWRHAHGMRALGIPNTRQFHDITLIEDAYALWEKLKAKNKTEEFNPEVVEEYEDLEGNVYNRKTYEDLVRQGII
ncbi:hypothetical protein M427DRAFT_112107 [Gonapodya prolifera JEL478]|uniref:Matrin-type domain-containing protein n=1 Tax=Gonapodya prolifera (strain JEL478) TaxID=1344416 RepID=A0A139AEB1_GONPJ|nr:hypothetical protein M427DRAFT_112107 [Gonapodya prolifera JEL478]|eukprot:KXS15098.1 hypothetical protein M427DRAFT_112107 [Gonapodya prolifera JEL478]